MKHDLTTMAQKAVKVYRMWLKQWPTDKKGALAIAEDFIETRKDREQFNQAIQTS